MPGTAKPKPIDAFADNMRDAHHLVRLADGLTNQRVRRMRKELRDRLGVAMRIPVKHRASLDCVESERLFLLFKPGCDLRPSDFVDHKPLLRQALVAGCAATETYLGDKVMDRVGPLLWKNGTPTERLKRIPMTVGDWLTIDDGYERDRRGLRERVVKPYVLIQASTAPSKVGELLSLIGLQRWTRQLDEARGVAVGDTEAFLDRVTNRRNRIAHNGDRVGRGRASLTIAEVRADLAGLESVVGAIEKVV